MSLPIRKSRNPKKNAPLFGGITIGTLSGFSTLTAGWPWWGSLILFAVIIAGGVYVQTFTSPADEPDVAD